MWLCIAAGAQPSFDWAPPPGTGYSAEIKASDFIEPTPASADPQAWDFSQVSGPVLGSVVVSPAASSPFASLFDGAQWVNDQDGQLAFWALVDGQFTALGNANATVGITLPFDDPLVQWSFPLELGSVVEDEFSCEQMLFGLPYSLQGETSSTVDAWGSLTMPDGTYFAETMRGRYDQLYTEIYDGDTAHWILSQAMYFVPDSSLPVFFHDELLVMDNGDNVLLEVTDVAWYANGVLSVPEPEASQVGAPFPNPIAVGTPLEWQVPDGWYWKALDVEGRTLSHGRVDGLSGLTLDTADWPSGLVLLVAESSQGSGLRKVHRLVVQ